MPFFVIEAINAAGKTTQFNLLRRALRKEGFEVLSFHFHQRDRATGQLIEYKFLHQRPRGRRFTRREQALMYVQDFFSRAEDIALHLNKRGAVVVADRFYSSTMAYQTLGLSGLRRRRMINWIKWLCERGRPRLLRPDLVILVDTPVDVSIKHLQGTRRDYFETRKRLADIRRSYLRLARGEGWKVISGADRKGRQRPVEAIHAEIWQQVYPFLR